MSSTYRYTADTTTGRRRRQTRSNVRHGAGAGAGGGDDGVVLTTNQKISCVGTTGSSGSTGSTVPATSLTTTTRRRRPSRPRRPPTKSRTNRRCRRCYYRPPRRRCCCCCYSTRSPFCPSSTTTEPSARGLQTAKNVRGTKPPSIENEKRTDARITHTTGTQHGKRARASDERRCRTAAAGPSLSGGDSSLGRTDGRARGDKPLARAPAELGDRPNATPVRKRTSPHRRDAVHKAHLCARPIVTILLLLSSSSSKRACTCIQRDDRSRTL